MISVPLLSTWSHLFSVNDMTVPYTTAAIELQDPFADMSTTGLEMYAADHIVWTLTLIAYLETYKKTTVH